MSFKPNNTQLPATFFTCRENNLDNVTDFSYDVAHGIDMDHSLYIDGRLTAISDEHLQQARRQLELPADFYLVEATRLLQYNSGNGVVQIPLPNGQLVAAFESPDGRRRYGVIKLITFED